MVINESLNRTDFRNCHHGHIFLLVVFVERLLQRCSLAIETLQIPWSYFALDRFESELTLSFNLLPALRGPLPDIQIHHLDLLNLQLYQIEG